MTRFPFAPTCIVATALLVVFPMAGCNEQPDSSVTYDLQEFDGVIESSGESIDNEQHDLYVRAAEALEAGDADTAEVVYRKIIAGYPDDAAGYEALGACLYFQARYDESEAVYLQALQRNAESADAHYGLGCVAYERDQFAEATTHLEKALAINQDHGKSHLVLAMVQEATGDIPNAVEHYERAIALDPSVANDDEIKQRVRELRQ